MIWVREIWLGCVVVLIIVFASLFCYGMNDVMAQNTTHISLAPGFTVIEDELRVVFIDYQNATLVDFNKKDNGCGFYNISEEQLKEKGQKEQVFRFGEIEVLVPGESANQESSKKIIFGPDILKLRTVITPVIVWSGHEFKPGISHYTFSQDHPEFAGIKAISADNIARFQPISLLYQLDVSLLIETLGGLGVSQRSQGETREFTYSLQDYSTLRARLLKICDQ